MTRGGISIYSTILILITFTSVFSASSKTLMISLSPDSYEPDSYSNPTLFDANTTQFHTIYPINDNDFMMYPVTKDSLVHVIVDNTTLLLNVELRISDIHGGDYYTASQQGYKDNEISLYLIMLSGYVARISVFPLENTAGNYNISLIVTPIKYATNIHTNDALPMQVNQRYEGSVPYVNSYNPQTLYYAVNITHNGSYRFYSTGLNIGKMYLWEDSDYFYLIKSSISIDMESSSSAHTRYMETLASDLKVGMYYLSLDIYSYDQAQYFQTWFSDNATDYSPYNNDPDKALVVDVFDSSAIMGTVASNGSDYYALNLERDTAVSIHWMSPADNSLVVTAIVDGKVFAILSNTTWKVLPEGNALIQISTKQGDIQDYKVIFLAIKPDEYDAQGKGNSMTDAILLVKDQYYGENIHLPSDIDWYKISNEQEIMDIHVGELSNPVVVHFYDRSGKEIFPDIIRSDPNDNLNLYRTIPGDLLYIKVSKPVSVDIVPNYGIDYHVYQPSSTKQYSQSHSKSQFSFISAIVVFIAIPVLKKKKS